MCTIPVHIHPGRGKEKVLLVLEEAYPDKTTRVVPKFNTKDDLMRLLSTPLALDDDGKITDTDCEPVIEELNVWLERGQTTNENYVLPVSDGKLLYWLCMCVVSYGLRALKQRVDKQDTEESDDDSKTTIAVSDDVGRGDEPRAKKPRLQGSDVSPAGSAENTMVLHMRTALGSLRTLLANGDITQIEHDDQRTTLLRDMGRGV